MSWSGLPNQIERKISPEPNSGCWLWDAAIGVQGYGRVNFNSVAQNAHRLVYDLLRGPIPAGLHMDHLCRTRECVNPDHMEPVTPGENARRGLTGKYQSMRTHCPRGHEYTEANTRVAKGGRWCRACDLRRTHIRRGKMVCEGTL